MGFAPSSLETRVASMLEVSSFQLLASSNSPKGTPLRVVLSVTMLIIRPISPSRGEVSTACPVALPPMSIAPLSSWPMIPRLKLSRPRIRVSGLVFEIPPSRVRNWSSPSITRLPILMSPLLNEMSAGMILQSVPPSDMMLGWVVASIASFPSSSRLKVPRNPSSPPERVSPGLW